MEFRKHRNGKSYPLTPKKIRDYSDNDGVEINISIDDADDLEKFVDEKRLKFGTEETLYDDGLNKVTMVELLDYDGQSYEPKLYQVNVNGIGMYTPAVKSLALEYVDSMVESAKNLSKHGKSYPNS